MHGLGRAACRRLDPAMLIERSASSQDVEHYAVLNTLGAELRRTLHMFDYVTRAVGEETCAGEGFWRARRSSSL